MSASQTQGNEMSACRKRSHQHLQQQGVSGAHAKGPTDAKRGQRKPKLPRVEYPVSTGRRYNTRDTNVNVFHPVLARKITPAVPYTGAGTAVPYTQVQEQNIAQ